MVPEDNPAGNENEELEQESAEDTNQEDQVENDDIDVEGAFEEETGLEAELAQAKEDLLRAQAEVQNARRRAQLDVEKAHKFGQEKLVTDILAVVDNLERALSSIDTADESMTSVIEGVELTLKSFADTLTRHNVVAVDPEGEPFDPQQHQAMTTIESADMEPNTVINVFQKGYTLHGRLIRPAMVVVSKAPAGS